MAQQEIVPPAKIHRLLKETHRGDGTRRVIRVVQPNQRARRATSAGMASSPATSRSPPATACSRLRRRPSRRPCGRLDSRDPAPERDHQGPTRPAPCSRCLPSTDQRQNFVRRGPASHRSAWRSSRPSPAATPAFQNSPHTRAGRILAASDSASMMSPAVGRPGCRYPA